MVQITLRMIWLMAKSEKLFIKKMTGLEHIFLQLICLICWVGS